MVATLKFKVILGLLGLAIKFGWSVWVERLKRRLVELEYENVDIKVHMIYRTKLLTRFQELAGKEAKEYKEAMRKSTADRLGSIEL